MSDELTEDELVELFTEDWQRRTTEDLHRRMANVVDIDEERRKEARRRGGGRRDGDLVTDDDVRELLRNLRRDIERVEAALNRDNDRIDRELLKLDEKLDRVTTWTLRWAGGLAALLGAVGILAALPRIMSLFAGSP